MQAITFGVASPTQALLVFQPFVYLALLLLRLADVHTGSHHFGLADHTFMIAPLFTCFAFGVTGCLRRLLRATAFLGLLAQLFASDLFTVRERLAYTLLDRHFVRSGTTSANVVVLGKTASANGPETVFVKAELSSPCAFFFAIFACLLITRSRHAERSPGKHSDGPKQTTQPSKAKPHENAPTFVIVSADVRLLR